MSEEKKLESVKFREGYKQGYNDALKQIVTTLQARDVKYKKDLGGLNYDLQTTNQ
tara:strand:+ start:1023 stop:1187 length:165 start_codon:yes stop_codon:yes gene_type:complete